MVGEGHEGVGDSDSVLNSGVEEGHVEEILKFGAHSSRGGTEEVIKDLNLDATLVGARESVA